MAPSVLRVKGCRNTRLLRAVLRLGVLLALALAPGLAQAAPAVAALLPDRRECIARAHLTGLLLPSHTRVVDRAVDLAGGLCFF